MIVINIINIISIINLITITPTATTSRRTSGTASKEHTHPTTQCIQYIDNPSSAVLNLPADQRAVRLVFRLVYITIGGRRLRRWRSTA